jgi:hypothetical protein
MELGTLVPTAPPSLARTPLEVGTVGGALWVAVLVESSPRTQAFQTSLLTELQSFLASSPDADELRIVAQVVGALQLADPAPARALLEPQAEPARLAA